MAAPARSKTTGSRPLTMEEREAEYRKLNSDLEARTAALVGQAQAMLNRKSIELEATLQQRGSPTRPISQAMFDFSAVPASGIASPTAPLTAAPVARPPSASSESPARAQSATGARPTSAAAAAAAAAVGATATVTIGIDADGASGGDDPVLESVLNGGLGAEATLRFLKAACRSLMQERRALQAQLRERDSAAAAAEGQLKAYIAEAGKADRAIKDRQGQLDKLQRALTALEQKHETEKTSSAAMAKELDRLRRDDKKREQAAQAIEVRLNRATEEAEKMRQQLKQKSQTTTVSGQQVKRENEDMVAEIKLLRKQKATLLSAFEKQQKLVDVLRQQRLHIEAAKVLAFAEDEFVKTLEWGNEL